MARQGKFGRTPRTAANLTNTVVSILRASIAQQDQNIVDAWQKGGLYKGQPVTDDMIIAYWQKRLDGLDPKDPLYDTYKNAVMQYQYAIESSKVETAYKMGTMTDQQVADFYLGWAKKVPQNSEFYRVLQRDAAQFIRAAQSKGAAAAKKAVEDDYQSQQNALDQNGSAPGRYGLYLLTMLAQHGSGGKGAVLGQTAVTGPDTIGKTTNLDELQLPSVDQLMALLGTVSVANVDLKPESEGGAGVSWVGSNTILFYDELGNPVTGADVVAQIRKYDPSFDGRLTLSYVNSLITKQKESLKEQIALAKSTGHIDDANKLTATLVATTEYGQQVAAWPVLQDYADLKEERPRRQHALARRQVGGHRPHPREDRQVGRRSAHRHRRPPPFPVEG
jgi:hypothetical protein